MINWQDLGKQVFSVDITKADSQPIDVKVHTINGKALRTDQGMDEEIIVVSLRNVIKGL
jgi:hypothetical protein